MWLVCAENMPIDRSWVHLNRRSSQYEGVDQFLDMAFSCPGVEDTIRFSCRNCHNFDHLTRDDVKHHLLYYGMHEMYDPQVHHGESLYGTSSNDEEDDIDEGEDEVEANDMFERHDDAQTFEMLYDSHRGEQQGDATFGVDDEWNTRGPEETNGEAKKSLDC